PRMVWFDRLPQRAWILGDFTIEPGSRSAGPAMALLRTCIKSITEGGEDVYDFPSNVMTAVYRRMGITTRGDFTRFVKLLRLNSRIRVHIKQEALVRGISAVGNLALRVSDRPPAIRSDLDVRPHDGSFGPEFTLLDSNTGGNGQIRGFRTAEYLNWRY